MTDATTPAPTQQMGALEKMVRKKAAQEAAAKFHRDRKALLADGHSSTWCKEFTYEDYKELDRLLDKFLHGIYIPSEERRAVNNFLGSVQQLLVQFPQIIEQVEEGARHE